MPNGRDCQKECARLRRAGQQVQDREGNTVYPLGQGRRARYRPVILCTQSAHGGAQAVGASRRQRRVSEPRRLAHIERLLRDGDAGARITFEWKEGALFAIPLNCHHRHFNGSGGEPARYVAVTNAPPVINLYEDLDFIFNTKYDFKDRFAGEPDYFSSKGEHKGFLLTTNFVPDAVNIPLVTATERGAGGGHIRFNLAKGSMNSHISQFPIGTYKKGHAHGPGAHVIVLSGDGYSLMWPEGEEPQRYDWEVGTLI